MSAAISGARVLIGDKCGLCKTLAEGRPAAPDDRAGLHLLPARRRDVVQPRSRRRKSRRPIGSTLMENTSPTRCRVLRSEDTNSDPNRSGETIRGQLPKPMSLTSSSRNLMEVGQMKSKVSVALLLSGLMLTAGPGGGRFPFILNQ